MYAYLYMIPIIKWNHFINEQRKTFLLFAQLEKFIQGK